MVTVSEAPGVHAATPIDAVALEQFMQQFRGEVVLPESDRYHAARQVRNGMIDRHPALIAECAGTADVVSAVTFAREQGIPLSVRGGGHNVAGNAVNDGGLVIDLGHMHAVHVDPVARRATVQGGATWGDVDRETQLFGLAVPGGVVSSTGVGGLTLHGGYGHLRRAHGLSIDSLVAAEVVTADGEVKWASEHTHPDLFWAIRGAGSNFGVVTLMEFALHPVGPEVALVGVAYPMEDADRVFARWRSFVEAAPDSISSIFLLWSIPQLGHFPEELKGTPVALVAGVHFDPVEGASLMQPLREFGEPVIDLSGPHMFAELQGAFDEFFPVGVRYYWKSTFVDDLSDEAIATMVSFGRKRPSPMSSVTVWHLGGAISRVGETDTAYGRRDAPYLATAEASWLESRDDEANIAWARELLAELRPYSRGGSYLNFPGFGEEKEAQLRAAYGANYDRLVEIKTRYDPANLFRSNLNIRPGH